MDHIVLFYMVTVQDHARKQASPRGIFGEQNGTGTGLPSSTLVFSLHCHFTNAPSILIYHKPYLILTTDVVGK